MTGRDGTVRIEGDEWIIRFERELAHPIEDVWAKLADANGWKGWLAEEGTIEPRVGGKVTMADHHIDSTVVAYEPPRVIEFGWTGPYWDGGTVRWELEPTRGGTRLTLTHHAKAMSAAEVGEFRTRFPRDLPDDWDPLPSTLAGWHVILDGLDSALAGAKGASEAEVEARWGALNADYKKVTSDSR